MFNFIFKRRRSYLHLQILVTKKPPHPSTCNTQWSDIFCQSCSRCLQGCRGLASVSTLAQPCPVAIAGQRNKATKCESKLTTQKPSWSEAGSSCVMFDSLARSSSSSSGGGPCLRTESSAKEDPESRRRQKLTLISFILMARSCCFFPLFSRQPGALPRVGWLE